MELTSYAEIIGSVKDWFGVIALIVLVVSFLFFHITKGFSSTLKFASLMLLMIAFVPLLYIKLFISSDGSRSLIAAEYIPDPVPALDSGYIPEPQEEDEEPDIPHDITIGECGRVYNLLPGGDGFLAVRAGPLPDDSKIDELYNNETVDIVERVGNRLFVIYRQDLHGWVHQQWIKEMVCK